MAHPERVASMVVGAAGWYTFPDPTVDYPFGIRRAPGLPDVSFNPARFLTVPACVLVGKRDVERDLGLNRSRRIDRHQGTTRLERGKRWIQAMAASAEAYNLDTSYVFRVLPGSDHSFADAVRHSGMDERVFGFLFGQERDT